MEAEEKKQILQELSNLRHELFAAKENLRDRFAMAALGGAMSRYECSGYTEDGAVNVAYQIADAMIDRRSS